MDDQKQKPMSLRYPKVGAPSLMKRLMLPRSWKLPRQPDGLALPTDPVRLIAQINQNSKDASGPEVEKPASEGAQEITQSDLIEFAIQTWRLEKRADNLDPNQFKREQRQFMDSVRRFRKFLSRFEVEFRDPVKAAEDAKNSELLRFDVGMNDIEVVSWDDPDEGDAPAGLEGPWIKQTVSPIIYKSQIVIKRGEVICVDPNV